MGACNGTRVGTLEGELRGEVDVDEVVDGDRAGGRYADLVGGFSLQRVRGSC